MQIEMIFILTLSNSPFAAFKIRKQMLSEKINAQIGFKKNDNTKIVSSKRQPPLITASS